MSENMKCSFEFWSFDISNSYNVYQMTPQMSVAWANGEKPFYFSCR